MNSRVSQPGEARYSQSRAGHVHAATAHLAHGPPWRVASTSPFASNVVSGAAIGICGPVGAGYPARGRFLRTLGPDRLAVPVAASAKLDRSRSNPERES